MDTIHLVSGTARVLESSMLEEMLSAERLHRGEAASAMKDFQKAWTKFESAIWIMKQTNNIDRTKVDSLIRLEHEFHAVVGGMFGIVDSLSRYGDVIHRKKILELSNSHNRIMASLDDLRQELLSLVASIELDARKLVVGKQKEVDGLIREVMFSLLLLASAAMCVTIMIWILVERNVARPIQRLMENVRTIDSGQLK
jgi:hypothetical protein